MWTRRSLLASGTVISALCLVTRRVGAQAATPATPAMPGMPADMMTAQACIESCWNSHVMCLQTERYCLERGGMHVAPAHLELLADCAEMCEKTANSLLRGSSRHAAICIACADLCDACAQECEAFKGDARMSTCAKTCRACAVHCRGMSKMSI